MNDLQWMMLPVALAVLLEIARAEGAGAPPGPAGLSRIELHASAATLRDGGPGLRLEIRNQSDVPLWVNKRLAWSAGPLPSPMREVDLDVRDPAGQRLAFQCKVRIGAAGNDDHVVLDPGQFVGRTLRLGCVTLARGTTYTIVARYRAETPAPKPAATGHALDWELVAAPVTLVVPSGAGRTAD